MHLHGLAWHHPGGQERRTHLRIAAIGMDAVDADAIAAEFERRHLGQAAQCPFGRAICGEPDVLRRQPVDRADIHDAAGAPGDHVGHHCLDTQEWPKLIDAEQPFELGCLGVLKLRHRQHGGIVDQYGNRPEAMGCFDQPLPVGGGADISPAREGRRSKLTGKRRRRVFQHVADHDERALAVQHARRLRPDATRCSGHDGDLAVKSSPGVLAHCRARCCCCHDYRRKAA
jgi:hypothetical protein